MCVYLYLFIYMCVGSNRGARLKSTFSRLRPWDSIAASDTSSSRSKDEGSDCSSFLGAKLLIRGLHNN